MKLRKYLSIVLVAATITSFSGIEAFAATSVNSSGTTQASTRRYIVKFKTSGVDGSQVVSKHKGIFKKQFKNVNAAIANVTDQDLNELKADSNVAYVEIDNPVKISGTVTTKSVDWGVSDVKAPASWQSGLTGSGVKIAVIDTGSGPHADLTVAGGANVITGSNTTSYADDNGHGTHVAGIIDGQGVNGGVEGVAPGASVYAVKALDSTGSGYTSDVISGIDWAITNKMDIVSMSLGSSTSSTSLQNAVDTAYNNGLLVVAAAGNSGNSSGTGTSIEYPAIYTSAIAVGALDSTNTRAYFSATGSKLEVSAPGVNILSTYLNGGYATMSGTSMATPFVAGDLALLKQKYPTYTNVQLRQLLDTSITDLGTTGRDSLYGYGLIQAPVTTTATTVETPSTSIAAGTYSSAQIITLSDTTPGVSIYYTLDGTTPTSASKLYSAPITISSTETLKAIAVDNSGNVSKVLSASYKIIAPLVVPMPIPTLYSGVYKEPLNIRLLSNFRAPLKFYYTLDGTTPAVNSTRYMGFIKIASTTTLKAIAVDNYGAISDVLTATYTIVVPPAAPKFSINDGIFKGAQTITITDSTPGASIYYTTNRSMPTSKSILYTGPITVSKSTSIAAVAKDANGILSQVKLATFIIR